MGDKRMGPEDWAGDAFDRHEVGSIYVDSRAEVTRARFVVSLIVGYPESPHHQRPIDALRAALDLTRDQASDYTVWFVFDRATGELQHLRQVDFDPEVSVTEEP